MRQITLGTVLLLAASGASADILDFNSIPAGSFVTNQFVGSHGIGIAAVNPNRSHDVATLYDSLGSGGADTDLEGPAWSGGNLAADGVRLGNVLIIAENIDDANNDGIIDSPDDEGNRPSGSLILEFSTAQMQLGFDVVDLEDDELGSIELWLNGSLEETINFADFLDSNSEYYDASVDFGDNHANRLMPLTPERSLAYDRLVINLGGSAAVDNVFYAIPAPSGIALAGLGLGLVARRRR